ncbi:MAG: hypothetical protein IJM85_06025 [Clostridia bacterium]|nr:hypothetical protein [Clostridia bacterium]
MAEQAEKLDNALPGGGTAAKKALIGVFCGFIAVFFLLILFLPKHEGELSPNERRILASRPDASFSNIISGGFSKQVDTWLQDHFPGRTFFVGLYSYLNRFTGRNPVENISLGRNSRLFTAPIADDGFTVNANSSRIERFVTENGLNAFCYIIPTSGYMLEDELPKSHLTYEDGALIAKLEGGMPSVKAISAEETLRAAGDVSALYYRTDHHLTMRGSYVSYCAIARKLGLEPLDEAEFTKTAYEFYGTSYGQSGLFLTPPDSLETWDAPYSGKLRVTTVDGTKETVHEGYLDMSCLDEGSTDKYAAYLYSNHGITVVENGECESGALLVLKDSYGNAIVPFLAAHYRTVVMIDTRQLYYSPSMPTPTELAERYGISDFLVVTGLDTVAGGTLDWLR